MFSSGSVSDKMSLTGIDAATSIDFFSNPLMYFKRQLYLGVDSVPGKGRLYFKS
jgi:hypothetical protein